MGGTSAAVAEGSQALFQNPAALDGFAPESPAEFAVEYDSLLETSYEGSAAYARPWGRDGALGAGLIYASQSPQTAYNALGDQAGTFTPLDAAAGAAYARRLGPAAVGAGLKVVRSSISDRSGTTFAADLGVVARHATDLGEGPLDVGASLTNLGPPMKLGSAADSLPLNVRVGGLWRASPNLFVALDLVAPVDQDPYASVGAEGRFPAALVGSSRPWTAFLRGGFDQNAGRSGTALSGASFGAGVDLSSLRVDYAWTGLGALGSASRVSLALRF